MLAVSSPRAVPDPRAAGADTGRSEIFRSLVGSDLRHATTCQEGDKWAHHKHSPNQISPRVNETRAEATDFAF